MVFQVDKESLQNLIDKYGYKFTKKEVALLSHVSSFTKEDADLWGKRLEIAQLVQFLRLCGDNSYKITSTIQNAQNGKIKGSSDSITFNSSYISNSILLMAEEMLHLVSEGEYEYVFGWDSKPSIEAEPFWFSGFSELTEPYSDEELNQIIAYEKKRSERIPKGNAQIGRRLYIVYDKLKNAGYFGQSKQKEYCFLYDWYVIAGMVNDVGEGYSGTIGKEKYQYIKNWIKAFENFRNKLKD